MVCLSTTLQMASQLPETTDILSSQSVRKWCSFKMMRGPQTNLCWEDLSSFTLVSWPISFNMIGLYSYYFLVTYFVKLGNTFPPSFDKKDVLEPAAHPYSGSSDTIVSSEDQYPKVSTTAKPIVVIARSNAVNHVATRLLLSNMESRHSGVPEQDWNAPGLPKLSK